MVTARTPPWPWPWPASCAAEADFLRGAVPRDVRRGGRSPHQVDIEFLPKGLHDLGGPAMRARLQEAADGVDATQYERCSWATPLR